MTRESTLFCDECNGTFGGHFNTCSRYEGEKPEMTEWRPINSLQELAAAQAAGDEVEDRYFPLCPWRGWEQNEWNSAYEYRARPKDPYAELKKAAADPTKQDKPKTKKVKLEAWLTSSMLTHFIEGSVNDVPTGWKRVPSEDKTIKVEE